MSKELARLPFVNKECMQAISSYEAQYGEIVMNGKRYIDELKEEEILSPRKVGMEMVFLSLVFSILPSFVPKTKFRVVPIIPTTFSFPNHNDEGNTAFNRIGPINAKS